jgi:hypothetical protein
MIVYIGSHESVCSCRGQSIAYDLDIDDGLRLLYLTYVLYQ